jgi:tetratricopeptide (TPR) repeat protein
VSPILALLSVAGLALVAAAGVAQGYRRPGPLPVEPVADPLDERRVSLLRSLADLDEARAAGALAPEDHERLRRDTESRIARLHRAIDERDLRLASSSASSPAGPRGPVRVPRWAVATLLVATVGAVLLAGLARDAEPLTAASSPATSSGNPFAFFEQRVRQHPNDLAARLDLAKRYLDAGRVQDALTQYEAALRIDPDDAEALANIGMVLFAAGRPADALESVDHALETSPDYPQALFVRGVILLEGLHRPAEAITAFERYLDAAPFGSERASAQRLMDRARAELERARPT